MFCRNLPDEAYQGNLSADESFHSNPSKQHYWSGMISLAHRHKEVCIQAVFTKNARNFPYIGLNVPHSSGVFDVGLS